MSSLYDLIQQRCALDEQIAALRKEERHNAMSQIKGLMDLHEISVDDIARAVAGRRRDLADRPVRPVRPAAAKYRDPATGATWAGRGRPPAWFDPARPEDFLEPAFSAA